MSLIFLRTSSRISKIGTPFASSPLSLISPRSGRSPLLYSCLAPADCFCYFDDPACSSWPALDASSLVWRNGLEGHGHRQISQPDARQVYCYHRAQIAHRHLPSCFQRGAEGFVGGQTWWTSWFNLLNVCFVFWLLSCAPSTTNDVGAAIRARDRFCSAAPSPVSPLEPCHICSFIGDINALSAHYAFETLLSFLPVRLATQCSTRKNNCYLMMEIATAPSTPENATSLPVIRRAFTVPSRLAGFRQAAKATPEADRHSADTLFAHNRCKIVSFHTGAKRPSSAGRDQAEIAEPVGTLPWATTTERTIAAGMKKEQGGYRILTTTWLGPLRIYRVLEIAFLSSGNTLRPILAKSQCWCVDGESKFVLKIGHDSYYRIELPNTCAEENEKVEGFKKVLAIVLQFEITPCPFKRAFTVELPQKPIVPIKKRPWRPLQQSQPASGQTQELRLEEIKGQANIKFSTRAIFVKEAAEAAASADSDSLPEDSEPSEPHSSASGEACDGVEPSPRTATSRFIDYEREQLDLLRTPTRPKSLKAGRAITAPPQLTLRTTPPSDSASSTREQSPSLSSSMDSFHSFHSPISPLLPSPPYSRPSFPILHACDNDTIHVRRTRDQKGETIDPILTSDSARQRVLTPPVIDADSMAGSSPPLPQTPTLISDTASQSEDRWSEDVTPSPRTQLRHRRSSRRRAPSPLPPPSNLYSPGTRLTGHHLTTAILQKTCSLLLGPPVQLVALMLNIARKISNGSYCGFSFDTGESGQKIPCSWDFSDTEEDGIWEEDDFGVSLGNNTTSKSTRAKDVRGSWEID